jgi:hypothetical protein
MLSLSFDASDAFAKIDDLHRKQIPFALSLGLNNLIKDMTFHLRRISDFHFAGGTTRYTKGGLLYTRSNKRDRPIKVAIYIQKDRSYLLKYIYGGTVTPLKNNKKLIQPVFKHKELRITKFGNLPRNKIKQLLGNEKKYFFGRPGKGNKLPKGVYKRSLLKRDKKELPKLVIKMDTASRQQKEILFPVYNLSRDYYISNFARVMSSALTHAIATSRSMRVPTGY